MRRILTSLWIATLYFPVAVSAMASQYGDVGMNHPNASAIGYLTDEGILLGNPDGTFRPDAPVNRAEFAKIIVMATETKQNDLDACMSSWTDHVFPDVDANAWYAPYICMANFSVIMTGYPDGTVRPEKPINFAEAAKMLSIGFHSTDMDVSNEEAWYKPYVAGLEHKYAIPRTIKSFDEVVTRAEMAEMISRIKRGDGSEWDSQTYASLKSGTALMNARGGITYRIRYNNESSDSLKEDAQYDGDVVAKDIHTGKTWVVVSGIKKRVPEIQSTWNLTLALFAEPNGTSNVIFNTSLRESDSGWQTLYSFDPASKKFTKMKISDSYSGTFEGSSLSPMQDRLLWTSAKNKEDVDPGFEQQLYVGDLTKDTYHVAEELRGDETFNGNGFALGSCFSFTWTQPYVLRYNVYNQKLKREDKICEDAFIETRTIKLP